MGYAIMNGSVEHFSIGHAAVDGKPLNISTGGDMKHVTDHLETNMSTSGESLCKTMLYDARVDEEEAMERHSQPGVPESQSINPLEKKSRSDTGRVDVNYNRSKSNLSGSVGNVVVNQETAFVIDNDYCNNDDDSFKKLPDGQHRKHSKLRALKSLPFHLKLHHKHDSDTTRGPGDVHGSPYSRFDEGHRQRSKSLSVKSLQFFKHCQQHPRIEQKTLSNWHSKRKRAFLHGHERSKSFDNFHQRKSNRLRSLRSLKLDGNSDSTLNTDNDNALYDSSMLSRLVDKPVHRKSRRTSSKKGKFNVTPPSTPTSVSSFSSQQQNGQHAGRGFYARNVSQTSVGEDEGIDGHFKFLETIGPNYPSVFTISNPTTTSSSTDDTQRSRQKSGSPKSAYDNVAFDNRGSNFSENKYNWTETDGPSSRVSDDYSKTKSSTRRICIAVCLAILVLAILAGVAVILAYLVFNVGDKKEVPDTTTIRPAILTTDGSLDLKLTWTPELNDPASSLYSETEYNFTTEMDRIMKESNFSDSYIRTEVIAFSPGSIKVDFRMDHNENYKQKANSANQYAADIEKHLKRVAREAVLPIDEGTVHIKAVGSTSSVLPSTTVAATSMVSSITTGNQTLTMTSQISPTKTTTQSSSDFKSSRNVTDTFVISSQTDTLTPSPVISSTTQPSSINATETYSSTNPVTLPSEQISKVSSHSGTLSSPTLTPSADLTGTLPSVTLSILSTTELLTKTETISGSLVTDHLTSPSSSSYFICNYTFVTASEHTSRLFITPTPTAKQSTSQLSTTEKLSSTPTSVLPTLSPTDKLTTSSLEKSTLTTAILPSLLSITPDAINHETKLNAHEHIAMYSNMTSENISSYTVRVVGQDVIEPPEILSQRQSSKSETSTIEENKWELAVSDHKPFSVDTAASHVDIVTGKFASNISSTLQTTMISQYDTNREHDISVNSVVVESTSTVHDLSTTQEKQLGELNAFHSTIQVANTIMDTNTLDENYKKSEVEVTSSIFEPAFTNERQSKEHNATLGQSTYFNAPTNNNGAQSEIEHTRDLTTRYTTLFNKQTSTGHINVDPDAEMTSRIVFSRQNNETILTMADDRIVPERTEFLTASIPVDTHEASTSQYVFNDKSSSDINTTTLEDGTQINNVTFSDENTTYHKNTSISLTTLKSVTTNPTPHKTPYALDIFESTEPLTSTPDTNENSTESMIENVTKQESPETTSLFAYLFKSLKDTWLSLTASKPKSSINYIDEVLLTRQSDHINYSPKDDLESVGTSIDTGSTSSSRKSISIVPILNISISDRIKPSKVLPANTVNDVILSENLQIDDLHTAMLNDGMHIGDVANHESKNSEDTISTPDKVNMELKEHLKNKISLTDGHSPTINSENTSVVPNKTSYLDDDINYVPLSHFSLNSKHPYSSSETNIVSEQKIQTNDLLNINDSSDSLAMNLTTIFSSFLMSSFLEQSTFLPNMTVDSSHSYTSIMQFSSRSLSLNASISESTSSTSKDSITTLPILSNTVDEIVTLLSSFSSGQNDAHTRPQDQNTLSTQSLQVYSSTSDISPLNLKDAQRTLIQSFVSDYPFESDINVTTTNSDHYARSISKPGNKMISEINVVSSDANHSQSKMESKMTVENLSVIHPTASLSGPVITLPNEEIINSIFNPTLDLGFTIQSKSTLVDSHSTTEYVTNTTSAIENATQAPKVSPLPGNTVDLTVRSSVQIVSDLLLTGYQHSADSNILTATRQEQILPSFSQDHMELSSTNPKLSESALIISENETNSHMTSNTIAPSTTTLPTTPSVAPPNTTTTKDSSTSSSTTTTTESTTSTTESTSTTTSTSTISSTASTTSTPSSTSSSSTTTTTTPSTTTAIVDKPPVAKAGVDKDIFDSSVTLDGSQSTDDNGIVQWEWLQVSPDTPKATLVDANTDTVKISGLVEGNTYVFSLTVKDSLGQSSSDTVQVIFHQDLCQPVTFEPCLSRGFEYTVFPNLFNHENASLAEEAFNVVSKDVKNQICQESALTYLCSLYFAKCDRITGLPEYPCGSLCNDAVTTCGNYFMNPFGCEYFQETDCTPLPVTTPAPTTTATPHACEETRATECVAHGFNETKFPNVFGEPNQDSALGSFYGFFKIEAEKGCHADMMYFVCSVQFPKCTESKVYKPCRRVCQDIIAACPDMSNYFVCNEFAAIDCLAPPKPQAECTQSQFSCGKVTKCISRDLVCNGIDDCSDWTDEMDCVCDPQVMFKCDMGMCIKSYQQCDGTPQCPDNSDERNCKCSHGQVACPDGKCIMAEWICDDRSECDDGWDESNCEICGRDFFTCKDRNKTCVPIQKKCDGSPDCPDGFDEVDCIKDDSGELRLSTMKTDLPICADSWRDTYGEMACERLGRGSYINKTNVRSIMPAFLRLGPSSGGNMHRSVLGPVQTVYTCEDNMAMRINCKPRGCGKRQIPITIPFIVNGEPAPVAAWPWHVALYYGGQYFCGGSLIHKEFVLTAAHCVDKYVRNYDLMTVKLGANNRESKENTQHVVSVEAVHSHTEHVYFVKNDIALIQLASAVQFTQYIQPICLPEVDEHLPLYSTCFTIGWGKTKWDGEYSEVLQQLKMTLWDTNKCNSSLAWNGEVFDTFLCAGYYSGIRSICTGDSGGPLLCQDNYQNWKVVGVSSYVANYCNMTERPNIFSKVEHFLPWINDIIECKFQCDNGKCLYNRDYICDRIDHCGDNSDETRICNRTVTCDFEDKFLCGYEFNGWQLGQDNKLSTKIDTGGILHTQSNAPQYDHTVGRPPGHFFYGKNSSVRDAYLWSPRFNASGQMCVRFAYYLRGDVSVGLKVNLNEYFRGSDQFTTITRWPVHSLPKDSPDEWKTGYFDISLGEHQLNFTTGDLLTAAIDDVEVLPGMCSNVLCKTDEYRCKGLYGDKCIPRESRCNLVIDCQDGNGDEITCANSMGSYLCTFEDGNMCGLKQEVGDGTDWWLVDASFVQSDTNNKKIKDHTFGNDSGHVFYINAYGVQSGTNIYMSQRFYLHSAQYCLSFYYQMRADVTLNVHVDCDEGCTSQTHMAQATFDDNWALFQVTLPSVDAITVTYDVLGDIINMFTSFIVMDDISVKAGVCPEYVCPAAYTKCRTADRCIPVTSICDRNVDCLDEYDEENCFCNSTEYRCANGRCLPLENKCDRVPQCLDKSDEGDVCRPLEIVSCSFEHSYICGYQFINTTNYKWRRYSGPTLTPQTGPSHDHTYGTRFGHYLYAEANEGSKGDNASVVSPQFVTGKGNSLEFYYHVFSSSPYDHMPGVLRFSIKNQQNNDSVYVWDSDPLDLRDEWRWFCYDLPVMMTVRAWFTSIRNETTTYGVDIAIDDVKINTQACSDITTPGPTIQPPTTDKTKASNCIEGQWECRSGVCVPNSYVCDKHSDCPDGSDEEGCP